MCSVSISVLHRGWTSTLRIQKAFFWVWSVVVRLHIMSRVRFRQWEFSLRRCNTTNICHQMSLFDPNLPRFPLFRPLKSILWMLSCNNTAALNHLLSSQFYFRVCYVFLVNVLLFALFPSCVFLLSIHTCTASPSLVHLRSWIFLHSFPSPLLLRIAPPAPHPPVSLLCI